MKKIFKGLICAGLCGVLAVGAAGCSGASEHRDPETSPLRLAIGAVDQKFNPLFYTSQNDGIIANMTQASLITADANGVIAYGDNYPTVALDYLETYYDVSGAQIGTSDGKGKIDGKSDVNGSTAYEFLIKNDMKFSDGEDLTVMDVLFNLYVYLDPIYNGSSTIYSTKIKGLQSYRAQKQVADDDTSDSTLKYYPGALERLQRLIDWSSDGGANPNESDLSEESLADLAKVRELYLEELTTDWNSVASGWVESYKEYNFTAAWQAFYYVEGIVKNQTEQNTSSGAFENIKGDNGKYLTTLDPDARTGDIEHEALIKDMENELTAAKIAEYRKNHDNVSEELMSDEEVKIELSKEKAIDHVYGAYSVNSEIDFVLTYMNTRNTALEYFLYSEMSKDRPEGELTIPTISGITVSHLGSSGGSFNSKTYKEDHDILRIEISGIDPKAKWNFGIAVAPMHYYSDKEHTDAAMADYTSGKVYAGTATHFGVEYKDSSFFTDVLAGKSKSGVPVGAGAYKCTVYNYSASRPATLNSGNFWYNNVGYFARNEYFYTMGANIDNAKIKYVTYKLYPDHQIVSALKTGEIDYGTPTATYDNQSELNTGNLKQIRYLAGGYGYVGINPKYVPDIEVRQTIMHMLDTSSMIDYYSESLVNLINRPMSTTSWAYPKDSTRYYEKWTTNDFESKIKPLILSSGNWVYNTGDNKFHSTSDNSVLKLTFTIAGETTDHPAYQMFLDAKRDLEKCGFEISVQTDIQALKNLATGDLAVWAAAWSSSIDPDPYQIYSVNSNASSTKNWNKDNILLNNGGVFDYEYQVAMALNDKIEAGRQTLSEADRAAIYGVSGSGFVKGNVNTLDQGCALDLIMELAVEFPTYQRYELCVYNSAVLDAKTMHTSDASFNMDPLGELWKVNYKK